MLRERRQDGISADITADVNADARCRRFKPAPLLGFRLFRKTADGGKIQTADKALRPLYAKGERKNRSSFFFSIYTSKPCGVRVRTADNTRPRFVSAVPAIPAVRVPVPAGTVMGGAS